VWLIRRLLRRTEAVAQRVRPSEAVKRRHERPLGELFGDVLELGAEAGLVRVEVIAVDGRKVHANASQHANRDYEQIAREILEQAAETDRLEDERFGDRRGDELPPEL
jgi:hypothetical protein